MDRNRKVVGWFTRGKQPIPITMKMLGGLRAHLKKRQETLMHVTAEATPSTSIKGLEWINEAGIALKKKYLAGAMDRLFTPDGQNELLMRLASRTVALSRKGLGTWEGSINPNFVTSILDVKTMTETTRKLANDYANALGYILKQDAVPWFRPDPNLRDPDAPYGIWLKKPGTNKPITEREANGVKKILDKTASGTDFSHIDGELYMVNFGGDKDFVKKVIRAKRLYEKASGVKLEAKGFRTEGNYLSNNWKEHPNGEEYKNRLGETNRQGLLDWIDRKQLEIESYSKWFTKKYKGTK
jgi:hypothetical protein